MLAGFAAFLAAGVTFLVIQRRTDDPMLPLSLFGSPTFSAASTVGLLINLGFYGELFVMSLYLQAVRGLSPLLAGVVLLPQVAMAVLGSSASGRVMVRTGPRLPMLVGLGIGGAGLLGLLVVAAHTSYPVLVAPFMATGLGMSLTMPAVTAAVMEAAPAQRAGLASGTINAARQVGGVIGVALLGSLVAHRAGFFHGLHTGMLIAAAAFLSGAGLTAMFVGRHGAQAPTSTRGTPPR